MTESSLRAFLDSGTSFQGKVSFSGLVRIDGHFRGEVNADGTLVVGETGVVEAQLEVGSLVVYGSVTGDVLAKERVEVGASGRVEGKLVTPRLQIDEGGQLRAKIQMGETVSRSESPEESGD